MLTIFEITVGILVVGWFVYPIAVWVVGAFRAVSRAQISSDSTVSVLIATRDLVDVITKRIANIEEHGQEVRLHEIILAVDYAARDRADEYRIALGSRVRLIMGDQPGGKAATLNAAAREASGDILIFTDSAQQFLPGAMKALVGRLQEPTIGISTGVLRVANNRKSIFLGAFWAYELWLRRCESRAASIVAITGALYALRRSLWDPLPVGLICDDLFVPLNVIRKGFRVVSCDAAGAVDPRSFGPNQELQRKVRTLTGMLQMCVLCPWLLNPWKNRAWLQFVFHKLLRILTPALIAMALGAALASIPLALSLGIIGVVLGCIAVVLLLGKRVALARKISRQTGWSLLFLGAPCIAVANAVRGKWDIWGAPGADRPSSTSTTA